MIGKLIGIKSQLMGGASLTAGKKKVLAYSWTVAKYVAHLKLDEEDLEHLRELGQMGKYPVNDKGDDDRIRDRDSMKLNGKDYDERALAFAYLNAKFGRKALKHIVVSYREGPVSLEMAERHRDTFLRVLGAENCAGFYGLHGDTDHPHFHLALCAYDLTDENLNKWGQGFEIEAIHIALALCERDDMMPCEPNRRYVADKSGVYHTLSGIKVADKDGCIYRSAQMLRIPGLQHKLEQQIRTPDGLEEGAAVPADTSIKILGRAALECAHDWGRFHQGLARVGLRYELYEAAGKIIGGYLVPIDAESDATPRVKASEIGAGYKKLVGRFGDVEYKQPPSDLWFRPFQTLGYVGKPDLEIRADEREKQQRLAEDEGLKNLKAEIASRHHIDGLSSKAIEKAREAKKLKRSLPSPGENEDALKNEDASYRAHERHFVDGLERALTQERGEKRGRPRKEPVEAVMWGAATSIEDDVPPLAQNYFAIRSEGRRSFYDGELLAFSETRNFVALHSNREQHQIDALLFAHKKFGAIRIEAPRKQRRQLLKLAIEYGILLDGSHQAEVRMIATRAAAVQLLKPPRLRQRSAGSRSMSSNSPAPDSDRNVNGVSLHHPLTKEARLRRNRRLRLADLRYQSQRDGRERQHRCSLHFPAYSIPWMEERNEAALEARGPNPPPNEANVARRKLDAIDRNELMLVSSIGEHHEYRFLDDQRLLAAFSSNKRWLLFADIQNRLQAMAAIQAHEQRWVAVAAERGRVKFEKEGLKLVHKADDWAIQFYRKQGHDARFQRLIMLAKLTPKRLKTDLDLHPGMAAWREAHHAGDTKLASYIAHELDRQAKKHGEKAVPISKEVKVGKTSTTARQDAANAFKKDITQRLSDREREALATTPSINEAVYVDLPWRAISRAKGAPQRKRVQARQHGIPPSLDP